MTYTQHGRINKGNAGAFTTALMMQKEHKSYSTTMTKFYEPVIGNKPGKAIIEMNTDVLGVEEFEVSKAARVERNENTYDLGVAKTSFSVASFYIFGLSKQQLLNGLFKKKAKIIYRDKNFRNFILEKWCAHLV